MTNIQLVVVRFNENLDWLLILKNLDIVIYNKGQENIDYIKYNLNNLNIKCEIINIPNIGREGSTYINHIINNYKKLYNYTIFVQGFPFDHCPNIYSKIIDFVNNLENINFTFLNNKLLECDFLGRSVQLCEVGGYNYLPMVDVYNNLFNNKIIIKTKKKNPFELEDLKGPIFEFGAGAQFIVSKKIIKKKPISFYKKIHNIFKKPIKEFNGIKYTIINPIEGFVIERLWKYIFEDENKHNIPIKTFNIKLYDYCKLCKKNKFWN